MTGTTNETRALATLRWHTGVVAAGAAAGGLLLGGSSGLTAVSAVMMLLASGKMGLIAVAAAPLVLLGLVVAVRGVVVLARLRGATEDAVKAAALMQAHGALWTALWLGVPAGLLWMGPAAWLAWLEVAPSASPAVW